MSSSSENEREPISENNLTRMTKRRNVKILIRINQKHRREITAVNSRIRTPENGGERIDRRYSTPTNSIGASMVVAQRPEPRASRAWLTGTCDRGGPVLSWPRLRRPGHRVLSRSSGSGHRGEGGGADHRIYEPLNVSLISCFLFSVSEMGAGIHGTGSTYRYDRVRVLACLRLSILDDVHWC